MFKKEQQVAERSRTFLKNKETKKLKSDLLQQFPLLSAEELEQYLPNKVSSVTPQHFNGIEVSAYMSNPLQVQIVSVKLASRTIVYCLQEEGAETTPIFFDIEGRGNYYPTGMCLSQLVRLLYSLSLQSMRCGVYRTWFDQFMYLLLYLSMSLTELI